VRGFIALDCRKQPPAAVLARDVAALEAAVEHRGVARGRLADAQQRLGQRRVAADAVAGAQVQVGQLAFEEARQHRADGVRVPQRHGAVHGLHALELGLQLAVVRLPDGVTALGDFLVARHVGGVGIHRRVVEGVDRTQAGDALAGVQAGAVRRTVQVDHVARVRGREHRGAQRVGEVVELLEVPVGVGHVARFVGEARGQRGRHMGADVRHRDEQRARALAKAEWRFGGGEGHGGVNP
jgi:hypothetical protein